MTTLTDILTLRAESYANRTGFDTDTIFLFLQRIMRERKIKHPRLIKMAMIGDHYLRTTDGDELRPYNPPTRPMILTERGEYYENLILARQERYWDD